MKVAVLQVRPKLCWSKAEFVSEIDRIVGETCDKHSPDLVVFPECMGLWLIGMEATTWWRRLWTRFLPSHVEQADRIRDRMAETWDDHLYYETAVGIQFSRPKRPGIDASVFGGFLSPFPEYDRIGVPSSSSGSKIRTLLERLSAWVFERIPLKFIAEKLRSKDELEAYREAFSSAAERYRIHIQAGSIFVLVDEGVKNRAFVYGPDGSQVTVQEKIHPIPFETMIGVLPGEGATTFVVDRVVCGVAVCYDADFPNDHIQRLSEMGCRFVCCPSGGIVPSHQWKWDFDVDVKRSTWARSQESGVWIGRSYNAGDLIPHVLMFQGRASITAPVSDTADGSGLVGLVPEEELVHAWTLVCEVD